MKYRITVVEVVHESYLAVEIEAETEEEAITIAEEMRVQGELPEDNAATVDVDFDVEEVAP
jgi:hypothetical protein